MTITNSEIFNKGVITTAGFLAAKNADLVTTASDVTGPVELGVTLTGFSMKKAEKHANLSACTSGTYSLVMSAAGSKKMVVSTSTTPAQKKG